ncbi:MAG: hypothetical protein LBI68_07690 [Azoarcus sp.]|jgi:hypothetical protein|nr:hypothetical protein [Azoarcus sp.]
MNFFDRSFKFMFCNACGADQGNRSFKFCPRCGAPLQAKASGPETAATPGIPSDPAIAAPYPESPPAAALTETTAITPLSSITIDAIPAFDFAPPPMADAPKEDEPPAAPAKTASEPSEDGAASLLWREVQQQEKKPKYAPQNSAEKAPEDAEPAKTLPDIPLPDISPEPEETAANACPEPLAPDAPVVLPPVEEPPHTGQHIDELEFTAPPTILNMAESSPATPDIPPPAAEHDVLASFPEWEKKYAFEISTTASVEQWNRIEPTMSGSRDFPLPIAPLPQTRPGSMFAVIGAAIVLILALSGLWWFFDRTNATPETLREDTQEASSETPARLTAETNETPPVETPQAEALATPAQETDGPPLPEFDSASNIKPEAPLMFIPTLPANQQPSNHNRTDNAIEPLPNTDLSSEAPALIPSPPPTASTASTTPSSRSHATNIAPIPLPSPPTPKYGADADSSRQNPVHTAAPPPVIEPEWEAPRTATPPPLPSLPVDEPEREAPRAHTPGTEFSRYPPAQTEAPRERTPSQPAAAKERRQQNSPPWRDHLRQELSRCEDFFCRERVRGQYCTDSRKTLPECRSASL